MTPPRGQSTASGVQSSHWMKNLGLLNDYVRVPYANGSSFASQFLYREFSARGHDVTVVGPDDPDATPEDMPERHVCLRAVPLRVHPGVRVPLPSPDGLARVAAERFDLVLGQCTSGMLDLGVYLRATQHVPFLAVHTLHLPSAYNVLLPDAMLQNPVVNGLFTERIVPWAERQAARIYNQGDGLIVLSRGLESYWRRRGVTVPIHVIPRSVDPKIFDRVAGDDPFDARAPRGRRFLTVCRHTREKGLSRLLRLFAEHVVPQVPDATLTLVGDGPDHDEFKQEAQKLGIAERTFFPGEFPVTEIANFYEHADCFLYPSLSETYGQVVSEAMWCGLPVVAFEDGMGVSHQIDHGRTGLLVSPGPNQAEADRLFAAHAVRLMRNPSERRALSHQARTDTHLRVHPERIVDRYYQVFDLAREHCRSTKEARVTRPFAAASALGRWATLQGLVAGIGYLRTPAVVNRHGRKQPNWSELTAGASPLSQPPLPRDINAEVERLQRAIERGELIPPPAE
ncbi:MAG: glycosyltransferase [Myxococcales bacterium]